MLTFSLFVALLASAENQHLEWMSKPAEGTKLPASKGERLSKDELDQLLKKDPPLPFESLSLGLQSTDGTMWVGSLNGLMQLPPGGTRWRLFHSRRWLPADDVQDLSIAAPNEIIVKTSKGLSSLVARETTLDEKMTFVNDMLQKHHLRKGLVTHIVLDEPGNLATARLQPTDDNDGLWTTIYIGAEAFRYASTKDPEAKKNARQSLDAIMFLERVSGIPGFVARSFVPIDDDPKKYGGQWHRSADNRWWWKGDTSSDELVGHYFAYYIYYRTVADEQEKKEIREYVSRITDHILDHGFNYVGPSGKPTTWGVWAPDKLNHDLRRIGDRGLNSLEILSFLKVAEHLTHNPRYTEKLRELIEQHAYATNTVLQKQVFPPQAVNHSDDELAFLSYYPLLMLERDPNLRAKYLASIRRSFLIERPERSSLFNLIYGAALQANEWKEPDQRPDKAYVAPADYDHDACLEYFRDVPRDLISWRAVNSERKDVTISGDNRFRRRKSLVVLPVSERHLMRWNGDPYTVDGGEDGRVRYDGAEILLPFWMGKYHRLIE
jgi:hypothetical protein